MSTFERIHDTINRVWLAPVIGYWDKTGRTRCLDCPPSADRHDVLIDAGNSAADGLACDICGSALHDQRGVTAASAEALVTETELEVAGRNVR